MQKYPEEAVQQAAEVQTQKEGKILRLAGQKARERLRAPRRVQRPGMRRQEPEEAPAMERPSGKLRPGMRMLRLKETGTALQLQAEMFLRQKAPRSFRS